MSEKNTNSANIKQKCNNKNKHFVMEQFDSDVNLAWTKSVEISWAFFRCVDKYNN